MGTCFIIQPFDNDVFDKRFDQIISPAIKECELYPYRVDRDPSSSILFEDIQNGISSADVCFADITLDNPNVWFELGFALAKQKEIVMICSKERLLKNNKLPFDIQHRSVIFYDTETPSDFETLSLQIVEKTRASLERRKQNQTIHDLSIVKDTEGLSPHEITVMAIVLSENILSNDGVSSYTINHMMEKTGYLPIATGLSLKSLSKKGLVLSQLRDKDPQFSEETYTVYFLTQDGEEWMLKNQNLFNLLKSSDLLTENNTT